MDIGCAVTAVRVTKLREAAGYSQTECSEVAVFSRDTQMRLEAGRGISRAKLCQAAVVFFGDESLADEIDANKKDHWAKSDQELVEMVKAYRRLRGHVASNTQQLSDDELLAMVLKRKQLVERVCTRVAWVYADKKDAEKAVVTELSSRQQEYETATVVDYSTHYALDLLRDLVKKVKVKTIRVILGSPAEAVRLETQRQAYLIDHMIRDELGTDYTNVELVRHNLPPSFTGFCVDDVVVCMCPYIWFPTFNDCDNQREETRKLIRELSQDITFPANSTDRLTVNGHGMPHVVAFNSLPGTYSPYLELWRKFDLHVRAIREYWEINRDHPDFKALNLPNPGLEANRLHPHDKCIKWFSPAGQEPK